VKDTGNLFSGCPAPSPEEDVQILLDKPGLRIERIVSRGHASPPGFWYDQPGDEWVLVVKGAGEVLFEGEARPRRLGPGDYLHIPAGRRHRVSYTAPDEETIWVAVHRPPPTLPKENSTHAT
jgi:cupin 2 domain-containing protein